MKHFFILILLNTTFWNTAFANTHPAPDSLTSSQNIMELSVWKIRTSKKEGAGVFIGANRFLISFDQILGLLDDENFLKSMVLSQEGNSSFIGINKILSVLPTHGLAVLETTENVAHHLDLEKPLPQSQGKLFVSSYLSKDFQIKRIPVGELFYEDEKVYMFPYDFYTRSNDDIKGGLVWDERGHIIGMASTSPFNVLVAIKPIHLKQLDKGEVGLNCSGLSATNCMGEALQELETLAEADSLKAQYALAKIHFSGWKVMDFNRAFEFVGEAASQGDLFAIMAMGNIYLYGHGVNPNYERAFRFFKQAAERGYFPSKSYMATMYYNGQGVEQDFEKAFELHKEAAEQGSFLSKHYMADMYRQGKGTDLDFHKARTLYEQNAEQGLIHSRHALAEMYRLGHGVEQDFEKAFELFKQIEQYLPAKSAMAMMYQDGQGVEQDSGKAFELLKEAARQGHLRSQYNLGVAYREAGDYNQAFIWTKYAAEQGFAPAQYNLSILYIRGQGTDRDPNLARKWLIEAASQGHIEALKALKKMEDQGKYTPV